jgi:H+/gluconate symporter-like permease
VNGLIAIGSTASVVGFGSALRGLPAFERLVDWVTHLPGDPLVNAALAVALIAGIAGSASGGQGLALPIIKPIFIDQLGVAPRALHRVVAIASGSLDSMPANGYVVMLIRNICGDTHGRSYGPIFVVSVLIPLLGTALAIALFKLVPAWGRM